MEVAFLNPGSSGEPFFGKLSAFMCIAADQLGIDLRVIDCYLRRSRMIDEGEALLARAGRPEYVVMGNPDGAAVDLLPRLCSAGIKVMLINEGIMSYEHPKVGKPRRPLESWLGQIQPDDQQAGYLLASHLIEAAARRGRLAADGTIHLVALAGDHNWCSNARVVGLTRALKEHPNVTINTVRLGGWNRDKARELTSGALRVHPETAVVWAASDLMAAGAIEAIEAARRVPGRDVIVGGVDWAPLARERITAGTLTASAGGHFMEGAWALVLLRDHHSGQDFAATKLKSSFVLLTAENLREHEIFFDASRWESADFARLSKVENPAIDSYELTPRAAFPSLA